MKIFLELLTKTPKIQNFVEILWIILEMKYAFWWRGEKLDWHNPPPHTHTHCTLLLSTSCKKRKTHEKSPFFCRYSLKTREEMCDKTSYLQHFMENWRTVFAPPLHTVLNPHFEPSLTVTHKQRQKFQSEETLSYYMPVIMLIEVFLVEQYLVSHNYLPVQLALWYRFQFQNSPGKIFLLHTKQHYNPISIAFIWYKRNRT
jgi:hypothetical protein